MTSVPRGIVAERAYRYAQLEPIALKFRREVGLSDPMSPVDGRVLYDVIQDYRVNVDGERRRVFCRMEESLNDGAEAKAKYNPDTNDYDIVLSTETYGMLEDGKPRGKTSLVHECAHVILHPRLLQRLSSLPLQSGAALYRGKQTPHEFYRDTEWQADALAAAITMPAKGVVALAKGVGVSYRDRGTMLTNWRVEAAIKEHYKVSDTAAEIRWSNVKKRGDELLTA